MVSRNKASILAPRVYLDNRGNRIKKVCQSLYASAILARTGTPDAVGGGVTRMKIEFGHKFEEIISEENLLAAWREFVRGKRTKRDVQLFGYDLIDNILQLHNDLANKTYKHGGYYCFKVSDPKPRDISKASVRDRLLHHAVYRILYPYFDQEFIYDSYSCRIDKGTHKAIRRLRAMFLEISNYNSKTCWVLKLDIRKFFANIDHEVLSNILKDYIPDQDILWLLENIIDSFPRGLPLGNLTSQLFVNIYMNEFDQFVKNKLKTKYYIRYADDFVILSRSRMDLESLIPQIQSFLRAKLKLTLHPDKITLKTFASGVDFLGWVNFPKHRVLRTTTKKRVLRRINQSNLSSYLGLIQHGDTHQIQQQLINLNWLLTEQ